MNKKVILAAIEALELGETPVFTTEDVPAFSEDATRGNAHMSPASLDTIMASLTKADIPTLERAVRAIDDEELAWLGFKVVYGSGVGREQRRQRRHQEVRRCWFGRWRFAPFLLQRRQGDRLLALCFRP